MDKLAKLIQNFNMSKYMPKLTTITGWIQLVTQIAVLAAPLVVLILGIIYFFIPPKEANHSLGYRFYWGMGSVDAWRFTQKIAGLAWMLAGLTMGIVMLLITNKYPTMELMAMLYSAIKCLLWQLGVMVVLCLLINLVVLLRYNIKGNVRRKTIIRVPDGFLEFKKRPKKDKTKKEAAQAQGALPLDDQDQPSTEAAPEEPAAPEAPAESVAEQTEEGVPGDIDADILAEIQKTVLAETEPESPLPEAEPEIPLAEVEPELPLAEVEPENVPAEVEFDTSVVEAAINEAFAFDLPVDQEPEKPQDPK